MRYPSPDQSGSVSEGIVQSRNEATPSVYEHRQIDAPEHIRKSLPARLQQRLILSRAAALCPNQSSASSSSERKGPRSMSRPKSPTLGQVYADALRHQHEIRQVLSGAVYLDQEYLNSRSAQKISATLHRPLDRTSSPSSRGESTCSSPSNSFRLRCFGAGKTIQMVQSSASEQSPSGDQHFYDDHVVVDGTFANKESQSFMKTWVESYGIVAVRPPISSSRDSSMVPGNNLPDRLAHSSHCHSPTSKVSSITLPVSNRKDSTTKSPVHSQSPSPAARFTPRTLGGGSFLPSVVVVTRSDDLSSNEMRWSAETRWRPEESKKSVASSPRCGGLSPSRLTNTGSEVRKCASAISLNSGASSRGLIMTGAPPPRAHHSAKWR